MPSVTIYLPDDLYFLVKQKAKEAGKKLSVYLRELIESALGFEGGGE